MKKIIKLMIETKDVVKIDNDVGAIYKMPLRKRFFMLFVNPNILIRFGDKESLAVKLINI